MTELTLLTKTYSVNQWKQMDRMLRLQFEGLDVEAKVAIYGTGVDEVERGIGKVQIRYIFHLDRAVALGECAGKR